MYGVSAGFQNCGCAVVDEPLDDVEAAVIATVEDDKRPRVDLQLEDQLKAASPLGPRPLKETEKQTTGSRATMLI